MSKHGRGTDGGSCKVWAMGTRDIATLDTVDRLAKIFLFDGLIDGTSPTVQRTGIVSHLFYVRTYYCDWRCLTIFAMMRVLRFNDLLFTPTPFVFVSRGNRVLFQSGCKNQGRIVQPEQTMCTVNGTVDFFSHFD